MSNTNNAGLLKNINEEGPKGHPVANGGPGAVDFNRGGSRYTGNYAYGICEGNSVLAAHEGIVTAKCEGTAGSCNDLGGYVVRVKSLDGTKSSVYAHVQIGSLEAVGLYQGAFVPAGKTIGLMGNSGEAWGIHIHFWSNQGANGNFQFSLSSSINDFNGDGKTDTGVFTPANKWYINLSTGSGWQASEWPNGAGAWGEVPITGDFNGDGKTDTGVFTPANKWYINLSTGSGWQASEWPNGAGTWGEVPLCAPLFWIYRKATSSSTSPTPSPTPPLRYLVLLPVIKR